MRTEFLPTISTLDLLPLGGVALEGLCVVAVEEVSEQNPIATAPVNKNCPANGNNCTWETCAARDDCAINRTGYPVRLID